MTPSRIGPGGRIRGRAVAEQRQVPVVGDRARGDDIPVKLAVEGVKQIFIELRRIKVPAMGNARTGAKIRAVIIKKFTAIEINRLLSMHIRQTDAPQTP